MAAGDFRWNSWNREHATKHGCTMAEIESVVLKNLPGRKVGDGKIMIEGRGSGSRLLRVVFVLDPDRTFFVIHAMPLTTRRHRR
jgi:uncharacterized DUF497 family protein